MVKTKTKTKSVAKQQPTKLSPDVYKLNLPKPVGVKPNPRLSTNRYLGGHGAMTYRTSNFASYGDVFFTDCGLNSFTMSSHPNPNNTAPNSQLPVEAIATTTAITTITTTTNKSKNNSNNANSNNNHTNSTTNNINPDHSTTNNTTLPPPETITLKNPQCVQNSAPETVLIETPITFHVQPEIYHMLATSRVHYDNTEDKSNLRPVTVHVQTDEGSVFSFIHIDLLKRCFPDAIIEDYVIPIHSIMGEAGKITKIAHICLSNSNIEWIDIPFLILDHNHNRNVPPMLLGKVKRKFGIHATRDLTHVLKQFNPPDDYELSLEDFVNSGPFRLCKDEDRQFILKELKGKMEENAKNCSHSSHPLASFSVNYKDGTKLDRIITHNYRVKDGHVDAYNKYVQTLIDESIVDECPSNLLGTRVSFTGAQNKDSIRFCLDLSSLNPYLLLFPLNFDNAHQAIADAVASGKEYFSRLDIRQAFYHMVWEYGEKELRPYFVWQGRNYCFKRLPFGLATAPALFNHFMERVLQSMKDQKDVVRYFDDIIICSATKEEHARTLADVMDCLNKFHIRVNPDKCEIGCEYITFLGHRISKLGVAPEIHRIQKLLDFPIPTTAQELMSFLGLLNFCRRYIPSIETQLSPLYGRLKEAIGGERMTKSTLRKSTITDLEPEMVAAKAAIAQAIYLGNVPDHTIRKLIIFTDASDTGIGGVIGYYRDGVFHIFDIISRARLSYEAGFSVSKSELLAINFCVTRWDHYLIGREVEIFTDHAALTFDFNITSDLHRTIAFWLNNISRHNIKISYIPGGENGLADYLSRRYALLRKKQNAPEQTNDVFLTTTDPDFDQSKPQPPPPPPNNPQSAVPLSSKSNNIDDVLFEGEPIELEGGEIHDPDNLIQAQLDEPVFHPHPNPDTERLIQEQIEQVCALRAEDFDTDEIAQQTVRDLQVAFQSNDGPSAPIRTLTNPLDIRAALEFAHSDHAHPAAMRGVLKSMGVQWDSMSKDIIKHCVRCESCRAFNVQKILNPTLSSLYSPFPMSFLNIDLAGPFDYTRIEGVWRYADTLTPAQKKLKQQEKQKAYILVTVCVCTGYAVLRHIPDKSANTVLDALHSIFTEYGFPNRIQSDQGTEFCNKILTTWLDNHHVNQRFSPTYHPNSNGVAERTVGFVKSIMERQMFSNTFNFENWGRSIRNIQLQINSRPSRYTGYSPFLLVHSRLPNGAPTVMKAAADNNEFNVAEWSQRLNHVLNFVIPQHCASRRAQKAKSIQYWHETHQMDNDELKIDQAVYVAAGSRQFGEPAFSGPFFVCHIFEKDGKAHRYKLRFGGRHTARIEKGIYTRDRLKTIPYGYEHAAADKGLWVEAIYHKTTKDRMTFYLLKFLGSDEAHWCQDQSIDDEPIRLYEGFRNAKVAELRNKGKTPGAKDLIAFNLNINLKLHPFLNGGSYQYHDKEDEEYDVQGKPIYIQPDQIPQWVKSQIPFDLAKFRANQKKLQEQEQLEEEELYQ